MSLHDDFDKEQDLNAEFDREVEAKAEDWGDAHGHAPLQQDWGDAKPPSRALRDATQKPTEAVELKDPGVLATMGHKALQGFWKGHSDELVGAMRSARIPSDGTVGQRMPDGSVKLIKGKGDAYRAGRDDERNVQDAADKFHPWLGGAAQTGGDIASDLVLKAFGIPVTGIAYQTASGGVQGLGNSDAELTGDNKEPGSAALATGLGAAAGYAGAKYLGPGLQKGTGALANFFGGKLEDVAAKKALKAAGYIQKDLKPILVREGKDAMLNRGRTLIDEGMIKAGRTVEDVAARIQPKVEEIGQAIGDVLKHADQSGNKLDLTPFIEKGKALLAQIADDPAVAREARELKRMIAGYEKVAERGATFSEANAMKTRLQNLAFDDNGTKNGKEFAAQLQHFLLDTIDEQIDDVAGKEVGQSFRRIKNAYGSLSKSAQKANEGVARVEGNHHFGILDLLAGQMGAGAGAAAHGTSGGLLGGAGAVAAAQLYKLARTRGPSTVAIGADQLAKVLAAAPEKLGKFGPLISKAVGRDALLALDYVLQKNPEYKTLRDALLNGEEEQHPDGP